MPLSLLLRALRAAIAIVVLAGAAAAPATAAEPADPVIAAAGNIAGPGSGDARTARLLNRLAPAAVVALGDNAGTSGTRRQYRTLYRPTWGRHRSRTKPTAGDRDYRTRRAAGYFGYFGASAGPRGKGYYSYEVGTWHVIALNSNCSKVGGCGRGSAQERWLRADLAAHPARCTLAYWHHPRFSSGAAGGTRAVGPLWRALHDAGADVVLNGHSRNYERFAPQDPSGRRDAARGIREFVVGTGGQRLSRFGRRAANSAARRSGSLGVLALTLRPGGYAWRFVTPGRARLGDSGNGTCSSESPPAGDGGGGRPRRPVPGSRYAVRGVFERDFSATGFAQQAALGFNAIDSNAYREEVDPLLAAGMKGFVWLGGYSAATCTFNRDDDWIRQRVGALAGHPAVAGYLIDDEPDASRCPAAPQHMRERARLVKSLDPGPPTFLVIYKVDELKLFAGTVDILAVDRYPCSIRNGCDFSKIDEAIAEVDRLGVRYWGVIQAHGDDWYRPPTPAELHQEFVRWRASRMEGYLVFSWRWPDDQPSLWLANNPQLQAQLAIENGR